MAGVVQVEENLQRQILENKYDTTSFRISAIDLTIFDISTSWFFNLEN